MQDGQRWTDLPEGMKAVRPRRIRQMQIHKNEIEAGLLVRRLVIGRDSHGRLADLQVDFPYLSGQRRFSLQTFG